MHMCYVRIAWHITSCFLSKPPREQLHTSSTYSSGCWPSTAAVWNSVTLLLTHAVLLYSATVARSLLLCTTQEIRHQVQAAVCRRKECQMLSETSAGPRPVKSKHHLCYTLLKTVKTASVL